MTQKTHSIDISPAFVAPIAQSGLKLLSLETTLVPGNLRASLALLEAYLSGLVSGQLVLAPAPETPVESGPTKPDSPTGPKEDG